MASLFATPSYAFPLQVKEESYSEQINTATDSSSR